MKTVVLFISEIIMLSVIMVQTIYPQNLKPDIYIQLGHSGGITSVDISPDGKYALSGSYDKTLRLWEISTGKEILTLKGHIGEITSVAISPDGQYAISGSNYLDTNVLKLWDITKGKVIRVFRGHKGWVNVVKISRDGKYVFSGSGDATLKMWNLHTGTEIKSFIGHTYGVSSIAISRDNKYVFSGGVDGTIRMWNISSGTIIKILKYHSACVKSLALNYDEKYILSGSIDTTAKICNIETGKVIQSFSGHTGEVTSVVYVPSENKILSGSRDNTLRLWENQTGKEIQSYRGHTEGVNSIAVSQDGLKVISGSYDGTLRLWDVKKGSEIKKFDGKTTSAYKISGSLDGRYLLAGGGNNAIHLWDIQTAKKSRVYTDTNDRYIHTVNISPDARYALTGGSDDKFFGYRIKLWDLHNGKILKIYSGHTYTIKQAILIPSGNYILSGSRDKTIKLWDRTNEKEIREFKGHFYDVCSVAMTRDGQYVFSGGDTTIRQWNFESGKVIKILKASKTGMVYSMALLPDEKKVLAGFEKGSMILFNIETGNQIHIYKGHRAAINTIAVTPDGDHAITGSEDNTLKLWDLNSGSEIRTFNGHASSVTSVIILPNGKYAISASYDQTVRLWDISSGYEIAQFISFRNNEWIILTPDGYFNCSPNGAKNTNVRIGLTVYSIDNFFNTYYRPDIVKARLAGISTADMATADLTKSIKLPPQVDLQALKINKSFSAFTTSDSKDLQIAEGTIKVKIIATDAGGGIQGVRLFNNGKAVGENIRGFKKAQSENTFEQEFTVTLTKGENSLKAVGFSDDMTESNPVTAIITYSAPKQVKPDMYILAIGINEYRNSKYNLNYCVDDMTGFVGAITPIAKKIFGNVNTNTITNRDANRVNVLKAMEDIKTKSKPEDVFIVFYAGHGIALDVQEEGKSKSEFFYVLSDVTQMTDPLKCTTDGLSGTEIRKMLSDIKAAKQVMFVDACNSGAFAAQFAVRGAAEENALAKLSRATGSVIYASTTKEQFATEFTELKHGAFTYVLIDALGGKASLANGQITVSSIKAFVDDQIPAITKKYKGEEQFPTTFIWGQDFPIGVK